jgi:polyhydroxyalkanoate synthase subunit PhaC
MIPLGPALDLARSVKREVERTQLRAKNGIVLISRRPPVQVTMTPKDEVWSLGKAKLWRYRNPNVRHTPPVILFMGLVGDSAIFDIHPGNSWAERLMEEGFDVFLFDWGRPEAAEGDHTLETYLNGYFIHAVDAACRAAKVGEVSLAAYCMGALMVLLLLGSRDDVPVRNLVLFTPPCDYEYSASFVAPFRDGHVTPSDAIDELTGLVPADAVRAMFRLRQPTSDLVQYVTLWEHLWRDDYVDAHRAVNHWAWNHRAMAGPAFTEMIKDFVQDNVLMSSSARLGERSVRLENITAPTLIVVADRDDLVPPASSEPLLDMVGSDDIEILRVPGGHAGALMGSVAKKQTMPQVSDWLERHSEAVAR